MKSVQPAVSIVLVQGGVVDEAGWEGVHDSLERGGYTVRIVQSSKQSLAADVAATQRVIRATGGPVLLVGHAHGGAVITEAGRDEKVRGLVYVAGFAPDRRRSAQKLIAKPAPGAVVPPMLRPIDGHLLVDLERDPSDAACREVSQRTRAGPRSASSSAPAWMTKPSWYLVATQARTTRPAVKRNGEKRAAAETVDVRGAHAVSVSHPAAVAQLLEKVASAVATYAVGT
jgi:hypothetical protein